MQTGGGGSSAASSLGARGTPAPSQNMCPDGSVGCQEPAPTMVIVIAGLCVMLFLIAIALLLLFYSYYKYRRPARVASLPIDLEAAARAAAALGDEISEESSENYEGAFLVLMPGDEEPHFFARPSPLLDGGDEDNPREVVATIVESVVDQAVEEQEEIDKVVAEVIEASVAAGEEDRDREECWDEDREDGDR